MVDQQESLPKVSPSERVQQEMDQGRGQIAELLGGDEDRTAKIINLHDKFKHAEDRLKTESGSNTVSILLPDLFRSVIAQYEPGIDGGALENLLDERAKLQETRDRLKKAGK